MDIDLSILRGLLEREKEISFDVLVEAIEQALLDGVPPQPPGAQAAARVELDRKTGHVTVLGREVDEDGTALRGVRRHPRRLRPDRRDDRQAGHAAAAARRRGRRHASASSPARRATSSPGSSSRAATPTTCWSTSASSRRCCPSASRCPGRPTSTASGIKCLVVVASARACAARRSRCRAPTRTWSRSSSRSRCPRSPTAPSRSRRSPARPATAPRSRSARTAPGVNAKGACIGPMGQRVRNVMAELHGEKIDIVDWSRGPGRVRRPRAVARRGSASVEVVDADTRPRG